MGLELETKKMNGAAATSAPSVSSLDREWLAKWIARVSDASRPQKKRAIHFVLCHMHEQKGPTPLNGADLDKRLTGAEREARIREIVDDFDRASRTIAARQASSFLAQAFRTDDPDELESQAPIDTQPFMQSPDPVAAKGAPGIERVTDATAVLGHLQRVLDNHESTMVKQNEIIMTMAERAMAHEMQLRTLHWEQQKDNQKLLNEEVTRVVDAEERRMKMDLISRAVIQAMSIGKDLARAKLGAKEDLISQLRLQPMQFLQMLGLMTPEQRQLLRPVIEEFMSTLSKEDVANIAAQPALAGLLGIAPPQEQKAEQKEEPKEPLK